MQNSFKEKFFNANNNSLVRGDHAFRVGNGVRRGAGVVAYAQSGLPSGVCRSDRHNHANRHTHADTHGNTDTHAYTPTVADSNTHAYSNSDGDRKEDWNVF